MNVCASTSVRLGHRTSGRCRHPTRRDNSTWWAALRRHHSAVITARSQFRLCRPFPGGLHRGQSPTSNSTQTEGSASRVGRAHHAKENPMATVRVFVGAPGSQFIAGGQTVSFTFSEPVDNAYWDLSVHPNIPSLNDPPPGAPI